MRVEESASIDGVIVLAAPIVQDVRGLLTKPFHRPTLESRGILGDFAECYHSRSIRGVLRGLHLQLPPAATAKLVTCVVGSVFDAVVDLRRSSPTFGQTYTLTLSAYDGRAIFIPEGVAHGFQSLEAGSTILCFASKSFAPEFDAGVRWDSAAIDWPIRPPILSDKDRALPGLSEFRPAF
jgi:dTDP-4-dehydrorhamnose 3,5-epimerase